MFDMRYACFFAFLLVACDDAGTVVNADGGGGGGGQDLDGSGGGGFVPPDATVRFDARSGPDGGRLARFREPCEDNLDCLSGWCVPF